MKKKKASKLTVLVVVLIFIFAWVGLTRAGFIPNFLDIDYLCPDSCVEESFDELPDAGKPVIYLYPKSVQDVSVSLQFDGEIIADYPKIDESFGGWRVTAYPDGHILNHVDGKVYNYLFWEGNFENKVDWDLSKGFVVKGSETREFFQEILSDMGLIPDEYNEFIVYWYPKMKDNPYNLIHFAEEQYTDLAGLTIIPRPDSMLRVFMVYKSLDERINIQPQQIRPFDRNGFTVVEWGGSELFD